MHAGAVSIEDPHDLDLERVLPPVVEEQRLSASLSLVIATANANRIDFAPIVFRLGVDLWVAIHFAC